jgi:hypothetical protein
LLYEDEEAEFKLPFGQEEKAVGSSEEEEEEEKKPEAKAGSGGFMSKFSLAGICNICNMHITCITEAKAGSGGLCPNSASQVSLQYMLIYYQISL